MRKGRPRRDRLSFVRYAHRRRLKPRVLREFGCQAAGFRAAGLWGWFGGPPGVPYVVFTPNTSIGRAFGLRGPNFHGRSEAYRANRAVLGIYNICRRAAFRIHVSETRDWAIYVYPDMRAHPRRRWRRCGARPSNVAPGPSVPSGMRGMAVARCRLGPKSCGASTFGELVYGFPGLVPVLVVCSAH